MLLKKSNGFCLKFVTASLLRLGALLRDNLQMGAFLALMYVSIDLHRLLKQIIDLSLHV